MLRFSNPGPCGWETWWRYPNARRTVPLSPACSFLQRRHGNPRRLQHLDRSVEILRWALARHCDGSHPIHLQGEGALDFERRHQQRMLTSLKRRAAELGMQLIPNTAPVPGAQTM